MSRNECKCLVVVLVLELIAHIFHCDSNFLQLVVLKKYRERMNEWIMNKWRKEDTLPRRSNFQFLFCSHIVWQPWSNMARSLPSGGSHTSDTVRCFTWVASSQRQGRGLSHRLQGKAVYFCILPVSLAETLKSWSSQKLLLVILLPPCSPTIHVRPTSWSEAPLSSSLFVRVSPTDSLHS